MNTIGKVIISILAMCVTLALIYFVIMPMTGVFEKRSNEIEYDVYKSDNTYIASVARSLAKYKYEYEKTDDLNEKESIKQTVRQMYPDFDTSRLDDVNLQAFLEMCRGY